MFLSILIGVAFALGCSGCCKVWCTCEQRWWRYEAERWVWSLVYVPRVHGSTRLFWDEVTKLKYDSVDLFLTNRFALAVGKVLHSWRTCLLLWLCFLRWRVALVNSLLQKKNQEIFVNLRGESDTIQQVLSNSVTYYYILFFLVSSPPNSKSKYNKRQCGVDSRPILPTQAPGVFWSQRNLPSRIRL